MFWAPEADLATVILAPSPLSTGVSFSTLATADQGRTDTDAAGRYLILGDGVDAIHLALLGRARPGRPLAVIVPLDADLPARIVAAVGLWRRLGAGGGPRGLTAQKRRRLIQMLRAVDGRRCGAAHREIAIALFGAARVTSEPWKTSSLRDATLRLVRDGLRMVDGGYRGLLRPRRVSH
ncbi:DUF2285 domain-containing protein [Phenylobacterium sp. 58.2.17]|uniref:DUF2285 domain-containing protein n=1 Tax=Phenylobacterium sp. 58.2.17 TaxID=2969306 RepID=UPI002263DA54|nr:DUF2285 domain-containing protein [Phenylobacterium sp. 58.2.17]MCX7587296.1 DUF2285 domain-containing protein [Phenylobacterium sp. 58.2.17]